MAAPVDSCVYFLITFSIIAISYIHAMLHDNNDMYRKYLASKTTYNNSFDSHEKLWLVTDLQIPSFCTPIQLNGVFRHGIRNPGKKDIANIHTLYKKLKAHSSLDENDLDALLPTFDANKASELAHSGHLEQFDIARRLATKYSDLLRTAKVEEMTFISSKINRTINSCQAFKSAFKELKYNISEEIELRNDLMRFYDVCKKYLKSVETSKKALHEFYTFRESSILKRIKQSLRTRLGLNSDTAINTAELKASYVIGAVEEAVYDKQSAWLRMFKESDLRALEYASDLKSYWKKAYGYSINYDQSCELLRHILTHLNDAVAGNGSAKKGIFRFGHAETLLPLMSLIGLFKDSDPLTADNYLQQSARKFRTSRIIPFSSNLVFVLYDCDLNACERDCSHLERHMVQLLFKEMPIAFPFCKRPFCAYSTIRKHYAQDLESCDIDTLCYVHNEL